MVEVYTSKFIYAKDYCEANNISFNEFYKLEVQATVLNRSIFHKITMTASEFDRSLSYWFNHKGFWDFAEKNQISEVII